MPAIFVSYRRQDSAPYAGRLYDRLCARFGAEAVFMDVDDIQPGADFVSLIEEKIGSCDALVAVIGPAWLTSKDRDGKRRLSDARDFVRLEITTALRRNILVVPVLVGGASMPGARDLPEPLAELAERQAVELTDRDFDRGVEKLVAALESLPALRSSTAGESRGRQARAPGAIAWLALVPVVIFLWFAWGKLSGGDARQIQGTWQARVDYSWGGSFEESFILEAEGDRLVGSASFLGEKRGIREGKIEGKKISFTVPFRSTSASDVTEHSARYTGTISGNEIRFILEDDRGYPPVKFVATKRERAP
ncbi:MAG TPA: toll/interleukin-1 receptor domain-containing protein [Candidatus Acidoferrales bacterium]|nr:toll/interleukin-1 receptor domain-containing protein [Candidatus Acidoferrales bacterium]